MPNTGIDGVLALRREWCEALDSGKFLQTKNQLADYRYTEFCCLGVAEEVVGPKLNIIRGDGGNYLIPNPAFDDYDPDEWDEYEEEFIEAEGSLHGELREALGLSDEQESILICLNDEGVSFSVISGVIQRMRIHHNGKTYTPYGVLVI